METEFRIKCHLFPYVLHRLVKIKNTKIGYKKYSRPSLNRKKDKSSVYTEHKFWYDFFIFCSFSIYRINRKSVLPYCFVGVPGVRFNEVLLHSNSVWHFEWRIFSFRLSRKNIVNMVCTCPCFFSWGIKFLIPILLWAFCKLIKPVWSKFWNPSGTDAIENTEAIPEVCAYFDPFSRELILIYCVFKSWILGIVALSARMFIFKNLFVQFTVTKTIWFYYFIEKQGVGISESTWYP